MPVLPYWFRKLAVALAGVATGNSAVDQQRLRRRAQFIRGPIDCLLKDRRFLSQPELRVLLQLSQSSSKISQAEFVAVAIGCHD
jgi:hypothetical protein